TVRLPVAAAVRLPAERPPAAVTSDTPAGPSLAGLHILVVDDEADAREVMRFMLERGGARVRIADSAAAALDAVREERPDLLISDIGMPIEDGYVMVRRLRALEDGAPPPARDRPRRLCRRRGFAPGAGGGLRRASLQAGGPGPPHRDRVRPRGPAP